ncbi:MAG: aldo/keto reductase [Intrasporangiaceae bacterium]|nr:aldo/keto reductase [Intrasporangiaceae bacterium]
MTPSMQRRRFGKTGWDVTAVGFGAWQIGGSWGEVAERDAMAALHAAADAGVNFFDTADVYGDGRSEQLIGRFLRERDEDLFVATKMGRRAPLDMEQYTLSNLRGWADRSRELLGLDSLGLVQLHCLPSEIYDSPEIFESLETLITEGVIDHYGVSVETVDEATRALQWEGLGTIQLVFNIFRQKPADTLLQAAADQDVGLIARVPLASGLLTGKLTRDSQFPEDDHRNFNRDGAAFDVGETFAGVDFQDGLDAVDELRPLADDEPLVHFALRWVLSHPQISTVIPGARNEEQARSNAQAGSKPPLDATTLAAVQRIYQERIEPSVGHRW